MSCGKGNHVISTITNVTSHCTRIVQITHAILDIYVLMVIGISVGGTASGDIQLCKFIRDLTSHESFKMCIDSVDMPPWDVFVLCGVFAARFVRCLSSWSAETPRSCYRGCCELILNLFSHSYKFICELPSAPMVGAYVAYRGRR